jgi:formamidopyrimidine-DNA glycosylase
MPELPEVETIRRQLAPLVQGRDLERIDVLDARWSRPLAPAVLASALQGRRVLGLGRRGKYLVWSFHGDVHLAQHLRMTGAVLSDPPGEVAHERVRMTLGPVRGGARPQKPRRSARGAVHLSIVDPRRFGTGELLGDSRALEAFFAARLGLEPLDERFTSSHLRALTRGRRGPIKALLLDQRRIAGVGNIYADEALYRARIHPLRPAGRLSGGQCEQLRTAVVEALRAGIDARGASISDFHDVQGVQGSFQDQFLVHRRGGQPCGRCGTTIVKITAAGRGTYVCERCQPRPRRSAKR